MGLWYHIKNYGLFAAIWSEIMGFVYRIRNVISWLPALWRDSDFDWTYTYKLMEIKFRRLAKVMKNGHCLHGGKMAKEALVAAALCKRITDDDYGLYLPGYAPPIGPWWHTGGTTPWTSSRKTTRKESLQRWYSEYMLTQDIDYLHRYLTKRVRCWWD